MRRFLAILLGTMAGYGTANLGLIILKYALASGIISPAQTLQSSVAIAALILALGVATTCLNAQLLASRPVRTSMEWTGIYAVISFVVFCLLSFFFPSWLTVAGDLPYLGLLVLFAALNSKKFAF